MSAAVASPSAAPTSSLAAAAGPRSSSSHSPLLANNSRQTSSYAAHPNHQPHTSASSSSSYTSSPPPAPKHAGCVLCGLVASAAAQSGASSSAPSSPTTPFLVLPSPVRSSPSTTDLQRAGPSTAYNRPPSPSPLAPPRSPSLQPRSLRPEIIVGGHRIIYHDKDITVYPAEGKEALCRDGRHLIIVLNTHATSVYELGAGDVPLLSKMIVTTQRLMLSRAASSGAARSPSDPEAGFTAKDVRIGFVNGMPADPKSPYPHLHAHAFLGPFDRNLPGSTLWRRNVVFSSLNWWALEDLRAEIREETSNNRIKSGYDDRWDSPIDRVPDAGAVDGLPNALDPDAYADDVSDRDRDPSNPYASVKRPAAGERTPSAQSVSTLRADGQERSGSNSLDRGSGYYHRDSTSTMGSTSSRG